MGLHQSIGEQMLAEEEEASIKRAQQFMWGLRCGDEMNRIDVSAVVALGARETSDEAFERALVEGRR